MKRLYLLLTMCLMLTSSLVSCSDDEDTTPTFAEKNGFAPAADDNSPTAQLQRSFYEETGVYLLFSDVLQPTIEGGEPERLDIGWNLSGTHGYDYELDYITDIDIQRQVAEAIKKNLLEPLGKAKPFSVLLVNDIGYNSYGSLMHTSSVLGTRCYAFSLDQGDALDDLDAHFSGMLVSVITKNLERYSAEMKPFYDISRDYYGKDLDEFGWESLTEQETWDLGFFEYLSGWGVYFPYESGDLKQWLTKVTTMSQEEFVDTYGSSAVMINKYELLVEVLRKIGINI